ncbi:MAG: DUF4345 domain-containing protein [Chloroflexota bacterium]
MTLKTTLLGIAAGFFVLYGLGFVFFPEALGLLITGAVPTTSSGMIDMRATYGGMSVALGLLFGLATRNPHTIDFGVWGILITMAGMAFGRLVGFVVDGSPNVFMYGYLAAEIVVIALTGWALRSE